MKGHRTADSVKREPTLRTAGSRGSIAILARAYVGESVQTWHCVQYLCYIKDTRRCFEGNKLVATFGAHQWNSTNRSPIFLSPTVRVMLCRFVLLTHRSFRAMLLRTADFYGVLLRPLPVCRWWFSLRAAFNAKLFHLRPKLALLFYLVLLRRVLFCRASAITDNQKFVQLE